MLAKNLVFIFCVMLILGNAHADDFVIVKVTGKNLILKPQNSESLDLLAVGDNVPVSFEDGSRCQLPVIKIKNEKVLVSAEGCSFAKRLGKGLVIGSSPIRSVASDDGVEEVKDSKPEWQFVAGLGFVLNSAKGTYSKVNFSDTSGVSFGGEVELVVDNEPSLILEGRNMRRHGWGFMGGLNYEFKRKVKSVTYKAPGNTLEVTLNSHEIQFATFYGSAVYRWENFFLPFGLNYSSVKYTSDDETPDISGALGAQFGCGWYLSEKFTIEGYSWVTSADLDSGTSGTTTVKYGTGYYGNIAVMGKYIF